VVLALATIPLWYQKLYYRMEEELRVRVEATLAKRLPHLDVSIRAAHLSSGGIEVRGLTIAEPGAAGPQGELAYFDTLLLECKTSPQELVSGEPAITRVTISRPVFRATRRPDGTYSLNKFLPLPKPPGPPPPITLEGGSIEVFDPLKNPSSIFVMRDLNLTITPVSDTADQWPKLKVDGYVLSDHIRRVEFTALVDPARSEWTAGGTVDGLDISPALRDSLPAPLAAQMQALSGLRAPASLNFKAESQADAIPRFELTGSLAGGRLEDSRLPYPLTDVRGDFRFDNAGFIVTDLIARDGQTVWEIKKFTQQGYAPKSPFHVELSGRKVHLDAKWATSLPEPLNRYWNYYQPAGDVNLDATLAFDGRKFVPQSIDATCLNNVSFSFHKFPYRLERARGSLNMRHNVLSIAMTAYTGPQPVSLNGTFHNPGRDFTGWIDIQGDKLPFDERLFGAVLKPQSHDALVSLNPTGTFNIFARFRRDDPRVREMHQFVQVTLDPSNHCRVTCDKFPYPLSNVEGTLIMNNGEWDFKDLKGFNGSGVAVISGHVSTQPGAPPTTLTIGATNIGLDEELRGALQPGTRKLWDALQPHGRIDATAKVQFASLNAKPSVWLEAVPRDDATSIGTSIEPVAFPYRMRLLGGRVTYQDGHATLYGIHAAHGATEIRTAGTCDIYPDDGWQLSLSSLSVDRVRLHGDDHDLVTALPGTLKHAIGQLNPTGPINLRGAVDFARPRPDQPLHVGWDVDLFVFDGSLQVGPKLENIFGRVRLRGSASGANYSSHGELDLDSLTYKNYQFTGVNGPLYFDNTQVLLGALVPGAAPPGAPPRRVTARLLGGTLAGDCQVRRAAISQYRLTATLAGADLGQFARENLPGGQELNGKIAGTVTLSGTPGPRNLFGSGTLQLTDADVYDLPVMLSLLKIARAKRPDSTAFTQSDIAFDIQQGEHIILKQINLDGDAISLSGNGELTLDGQSNPISLRLHTSAGRGGLPIVSGMLSEASQQILLIHVGGTLNHPEMRTEPFPVANQALQQLQADPDKPSLLNAGNFMRTLGLRR